MHEAQFGLLVSVCISLFFALIGHVTVCAEQHNCVEKGTCYSLNSGSLLDPSCSFRTTVTPAGYKLLNASVQYETMQLMNRGVCAPGLRQSVDPATGDGLPSNPFYDAAAPRSWASRVWTLGLRQPFRATLRPGHEHPSARAACQPGRS